jgi:hypothetical protein
MRQDRCKYKKDNPMEMTVSNQPPVWQPAGQDVTTQSQEASRTGLALLSNSQHMDLSLVTAEGDKVTLSLDSSTTARSVMKEEVQNDGQGSMSYEKSEFTMGLYQRDLTFTVEGDLSKEEMRDIRKVLKSLDKMMNKFVTGQMGAMAAQAVKLSGLDTIAGLEANMSYQRQVLVAQQSQVTTTYTSKGLPSTMPPAVEAITDGSQNPEIDDLAQGMAQEIQSAATPASRMMQFVNQLMKDYRQQAAKSHHKGPHMIDRVHHKLDHMLKNRYRSWKTKH